MGHVLGAVSRSPSLTCVPATHLKLQSATTRADSSSIVQGKWPTREGPRTPTRHDFKDSETSVTVTPVLPKLLYVSLLENVAGKYEEMLSMSIAHAVRHYPVRRRRGAAWVGPHGREQTGLPGVLPDGAASQENAQLCVNTRG